MRYSIQLIIVIFLLFCSNQSNAQVFSLNMNSLSAAALTIHTELEVSVSKNFTFSTGILFKPVCNYRIGGIFVSARRYYKESFVGPSIGLNSGYLTYHVTENGLTGRALYASLTGGYNFILSKRFNLKLELGASLLYACDSYLERTEDPMSKDYLYSHRRLIILPFPVSVSFCYIF